MKTVNVHEAKTNLSRILKEIADGETYLICRNGHPVARIEQHIPRKRTEKNSLLSKISVNYDPTEPLKQDEWEEID